MNERTKDILKFLAPFLIPALVIPMAIYMILNTDADVSDHNRREAIHTLFEKDAKSIKLPNQFTIKNFEKGGKVDSSILDSIIYRTRIPKSEAIIRVDEELKRLNWSFWKKEDNSYVYCKSKFVADVYVEDYLPERSTDITIYFILGLKSVSGANVPKQCLE